MHKSSILFASLVLSALPALAQTPADSIPSATDSIPDQKLGELVVTAERGWIEDGKANFIPTKREKQLSNSPAELIGLMHLPMLLEKDGSIVGVDGKGVEIFINGERADKIDISTFWAKDVRRVEYIENPKEGNFDGARKVVNFIMQKYVVGGVTKLSAFKRNRVNSNNLDASSKIVYKRMTYGLLATGNFYRDHFEGESGTSVYKDLYYGGKHYDEIVQEMSDLTYVRMQYFNISANAKYVNGEFTALHTVSFRATGQPGSGSSGTSKWSDNLFDSEITSSYKRTKSFSPQISGRYYGYASPKWYLIGQWNYSFARNLSNSRSQTGNAPMIFNAIDEDVNSFSFSFTPTFYASDKWTLQLKAQSSHDWYYTAYTGSADTRQRLYRNDIEASASVWWVPSQDFYMSLTPGMKAAIWKIGNISEHTVKPAITASFNWTPHRKFMAWGSLNHDFRSPSVGNTNPVPVRTSELFWTVGNPYLKNYTSWLGDFTASFIPNNWLNMSLTAMYGRVSDEIVTIYSAASPEMEGLIKESVNARPSDSFSLGYNINGSFFKKILSVRLSPSWVHDKMRGLYGRTLDAFIINAAADYLLGNVRLHLDYSGPFKYILEAGMSMNHVADRWNSSVSYGYKGWNLQLHFENMFHRRRIINKNFVSDHYLSRTTSFNAGRSIMIRASYTFGWGKKVSQSIEISGPSEAKTSVRD